MNKLKMVHSGDCFFSSHHHWQKGRNHKKQHKIAYLMVPPNANLKAVSYTHLDVYKIQLYNTFDLKYSYSAT